MLSRTKVFAMPKVFAVTARRSASGAAPASATVTSAGHKAAGARGRTPGSRGTVST
jgi:hypothetical protein